jgi:hypothetical protein
MFIFKRKTIMAGAAIAALMSVGCITALAATAAPTLSPAGYVDLSKIDVQAGTYTVGDGINIQFSDGQTAKTAPAETLIPVSANLGIADIQEGTFTVVEGITPQLSNGQTASTAPAGTLSPTSDSLDTANVRQGSFTVAGALSTQIVNEMAGATTAGK